jgi:hypothetical protein
MIATKNFLFIHTPKCAGMSLTDWLIRNLEGEIYYFVPKGHYNAELTNDNIIEIEGMRHENLKQAKEGLLKINIKIEDIECILTTIRNPYDLEISRFNYLRLGHPWDKGLPQDIALNYNFKTFAKHAPFMGRSVCNFGIEAFYELEGKIPDNLRIIKFENLDTIPKVVSKHLKSNSVIPKTNSTYGKEYSLKNFYNKESEVSIFKKYRWIFENNYYERLKL